MEITLKNDDIQKANESAAPAFPKYTSQLINWANQNAHGTRPQVVGQLSELFPEYQQGAPSVSLADWGEWYLKKHPQAIGQATDKIYAQVLNLQKAIQLIDKDLVEARVRDLVITKTFNGLYVQRAILAALAARKNAPFRLATPQEEAKGVDGYVGDTPYSVKPDSYKAMGRLPESIPVKMIYYTKTKTGLKIEVEE